MRYVPMTVVAVDQIFLLLPLALFYFASSYSLAVFFCSKNVHTHTQNEGKKDE